MKKTVAAFYAICTIFLTFNSAYSFEYDANSVLRSWENLRLKPNSRYILSCPSIIEKIDTTDKGNVKFFFQTGEPFDSHLRSANIIVMKTYAETVADFEISMLDGNHVKKGCNIKSNHKKLGHIAGNCRIEP